MYYLVNVDDLWDGLECYAALFPRKSICEVIVTHDRFMEVLDELALLAQEQTSVQLITNLPAVGGNHLFDDVKDHWIDFLCELQHLRDLDAFQALIAAPKVQHTFILFSPKRGLHGYVPEPSAND